MCTVEKGGGKGESRPLVSSSSPAGLQLRSQSQTQSYSGSALGGNFSSAKESDPPVRLTYRKGVLVSSPATSSQAQAQRHAFHLADPAQPVNCRPRPRSISSAGTGTGTQNLNFSTQQRKSSLHIHPAPDDASSFNHGRQMSSEINSVQNEQDLINSNPDSKNVIIL